MSIRPAVRDDVTAAGDPDNFRLMRFLIVLLMSPAGRRSFTLLLLGLSCFLWPQEAHAYLDPGSGSSFFQLLIAMLLGGLFMLKLSWQRIKTRFKETMARKRKQDQHAEP